MISIEEISPTHPLEEKTTSHPDTVDTAHYAILVDSGHQKLYVATFSNIFVLVDLLISDELLQDLVIYRTQNTPPGKNDLLRLYNTLFESRTVK